jgi:hypothetical protein
MSMAEVGTYWTLLVRQMVEGHVKTDLSEYLKRLNVPNMQEASLLVTPRVAKKFHTANCKNKMCAGWSACNVPGDDPTELYNRKLVEVIADMDGWSERNKNNVAKRYGEIKTKPLEAAQQGGASVEETPIFDFSELLRIMPKRKKNGVAEGWENGKRQLKFITTQEEFDNLMAATREYARTRKGDDAAFHIALDNWLTKEYFRYIPEAATQLPSTPTAVNAAATQPVVEVKRQFPPAWLRPEDAVRQLKPGQTPPWIVDTYDLAGRKRAKEQFPDDESKRRWWMESDSNETTVGA